MTVMMPKGTSTIPIPELSVTASGNVVALKLVSFVVIVTVINVVLDVTLSLGLELGDRKGMEVVVAGVERKRVVVLAAVTAMVRWDCCSLNCVFPKPQPVVCFMVDSGAFPLGWDLLGYQRRLCNKELCCCDGM